MENRTVNDLIALKIVHYLITPTAQWDASGAGVDSSKYGLFEKLMIRLKAYLSNAPGYNKGVTSATAGKEFFGTQIAGAAVSKWSPSNKIFLPGMRSSFMKEDGEVPGNAIANASVGPSDIAVPVKNKILRRKGKIDAIKID